MTRPITAFINELTDILEDIKDNEKVNPNDTSSGFSDTFTLQSELDYFKRIREEIEQNKALLKEKSQSLWKGTEAENTVWKTLQKSKKISKITTELEKALKIIRKEGNEIRRINLLILECQRKYDLFKKIHVGLLNSLITANDSIESLKEEIPTNRTAS